MSETRPLSSEMLRAHAALEGDERLWGVVDGARCLELAWEAKARHGQEIRSLFAPAAAPGLADVAPYLVPVDANGPYVESWLSRWGSCAGILLVSASSADALWDHLRSIFVVTDEAGQEYFFRFYDPRVLRPFLPTCSPGQLAEVFGPVARYLVEGEDPGVLLRYHVAGGRLATERLSLSSEGAGPAGG